MHQSGFVNIVGLPNVGKSTLLNALVGERLAIISPKAQTTRQRLMGLVNTENYQVVFSDTPGYINQPAYALHKAMNSFVHQCFEDADVLLLVTDRWQKIEDQSFLIAQMQRVAVPQFVVLNKLDMCTTTDVEQTRAIWMQQLPNAHFLAVSAAQKMNLTGLVEAIAKLLPQSPAFYSKEELSDRNLRYFASEMVREQIFLNYDQEIPYSCVVDCQDYKELPDIDHIRCVIYVERNSQKNILIGKGGSAITKVGTAARKNLEEWLGKKVFLDLFVKVRPNWRSNPIHLRSFGFQAEEK